MDPISTRTRPHLLTTAILQPEPRIVVEMVTHSPSPSISCTKNLPSTAQLSRVSDEDSRYRHQGSSSKVLRNIHISGMLIEDFLELARENTDKDLETCGILGASLKEGIFYATTLIIPKQEATSSSCQALEEEKIFAVQNERSLYTVGWIHTHPSQSCFMSSIDLHTQYSYQVMVTEAIAIVVAPTDTTRSYGLFRLSDGIGMSTLRDCQEKGFHPHKEPSKDYNDGDRSPLLYELCSHVYINPNLRFEIFDLR